MTVRHLVSLMDWPVEDIRRVQELAVELKRRHAKGTIEDCLKRKTVALYFEKPSTRTRFSFEVAMHHLGGAGLYVDMQGQRLGQRESIKDVARVMSRMVEGIMARTYAHDTVVELARHASIPVINGLTDYVHPMQALADWMTIGERLGRDSDFTIAYVGDGNNVARSLAIHALKFGARLIVAAPEAYRLPTDFTKGFPAGEPLPGELVNMTDPVAAVRQAQVVYTDVWASMGQEAEGRQRERDFAPYQVNAKLMAAAPKGAFFMHCLPAHRGLEVTDDVVDSPVSVVYDQAENRLHTAKAVLVELMT